MISFGVPQEGWGGEDGERERAGAQMKTMGGWVGGEEREQGAGSWDVELV